eukprot:TsM_000895800 transcript=TsM_000895800 gene=TsM_000895800
MAKVNHFPCSFHLGRKDRLWRNISAMQKRFGVENFNFTPLTFCIPADLEKFKAVWDTEGAEHQWILKPLHQLTSLRWKSIRSPNKLLHQLPKCRLRLQRERRNLYRPQMVSSLRAFWAYLRSHSVEPEPVWSSIKDVIAKTCIAIEPHFKNAVDTYCKSPYSVQELFGFDVFLDANLKPWVLEVNVSPSMHIDSPLDSKVKSIMIKDMLNLTGFNLPSPRDISNRNTRTSTMLPSCGIPQLPPDQHLNIDSDDVRFTSEQNISPISDDAPPIKNEPLKWMEEIKKPTAPPHPWLLDRRATMSKLSDDERKKHEYYVIRAYEACLSRLSKTPRALKHLESPSLNIIQPEIPLDLEPLPPLIALDESTIPTSISQGAGPDSLDLATFTKIQEEHKRAMAKRRMEHKQLIHRANMQVFDQEDRWEAVKEQSESPIGGKSWEEGDNFELAAASRSKSTHEPSTLEHFRWAVENVLDFITPFDLRCLVQMLDAKKRAGAFQPVFPADNTSRTASYLRFFDEPRYANLLIFAYLDKYGESAEGIAMLSELCEREVHLKSRFFGDKLEESNIWKPPLPLLIPSTRKGYVENRDKQFGKENIGKETAWLLRLRRLGLRGSTTGVERGGLLLSCKLLSQLDLLGRLTRGDATPITGGRKVPLPPPLPLLRGGPAVAEDETPVGVERPEVEGERGFEPKEEAATIAANLGLFKNADIEPALMAFNVSA